MREGRQGAAGAGYGPLDRRPRRAAVAARRASATRSSRSRASRRSRAGEPTPSDPDGTAAFAAPRRQRQRAGQQPRGRRQRGRTRCRTLPGFVYDPAGRRRHDDDRGRQARQPDPRVRQPRRHATTTAPAASTPWGTWLTCEETESRRRPDQAARLRLRGRPLRPGRQPRPASRSRRSAATRTRRSSSTPTRGTIYLTEDAGNPNGLLYRWTPPDDGAAAAAAARCATLADDAGDARGAEGVRRATARSCPTSPSPPSPARRYGVEWVDGPRPRRDDDVRRASSSATARSPAAASSRACGGATAARTSSCSFARTSTAARPSTTARSGSSTRCDGHDRAQAALRLHAGRPGQRPRRAGQHHRLALRRRDHRRGRRGQAAPRRRRPTAARRSSSPATTTRSTPSSRGPTFSHDKKTLFANVQTPGLRVRDPRAVPQAAPLTPAPGGQPPASCSFDHCHSARSSVRPSTPAAARTARHACT